MGWVGVLGLQFPPFEEIPQDIKAKVQAQFDKAWQAVGLDSNLRPSEGGLECILSVLRCFYRC